MRAIRIISVEGTEANYPKPLHLHTCDVYMLHRLTSSNDGSNLDVTEDG